MNIEDQLMQLDERSDYAREVLGRLPSWLLQWGTTLVLGVVILALGLSWILKYPDIIPAPITLTTALPPLRIVAPASGELRIIADASAPVQPREPVALITNSVPWDELRQVKDWLADLNDFEGEHAAGLNRLRNAELGELQPPFNEFVQQFQTYRFLLAEQASEKRRTALLAERERLNHLRRQQQSQLETMSAEKQLAEESLGRFRKLLKKHLVSAEMVDEKKARQLSLVREEKQQMTLIADTDVEIAQLEKELLNIQLTHDEQLRSQRLKLDVAHQNLLSEISRWEHKYLLRASIGGYVSWSHYWSDHQYVRMGDEVFTVVPAKHQTVIGKVSMPMHNSGKVKVGQLVYIKLEGFPYQEFGILAGRVRHIALIPNDQAYQIEVELPQPLVTSFHKTLPFRQEMLGRAEIVTEDLRLLERVYYQLAGALKQQG